MRDDAPARRVEATSPGERGSGFIAHATPSARVQPDGTWVARYEGLPEIEGVADTEADAIERLVSEYEIWLFHRGGLAKLKTLAETGGSADIAIAAISLDEANSVKDAIARQWTKAVDELGDPTV